LIGCAITRRAIRPPRHLFSRIQQNTDQGSQFTSMAFTAILLREKVAISMDGRGAWRDNVFVERLWRSVKYEEVYLRAYGSVSEARASIGRYLASTMDGGRTRHLTAGRPITSTSTHRFSQRHETGGRST
jgi:putative transposase